MAGQAAELGYYQTCAKNRSLERLILWAFLDGMKHNMYYVAHWKRHVIPARCLLAGGSPLPAPRCRVARGGAAAT